MKALFAAAVIIAVTAYLVFLGASSPWQYYLLVDECYTQQDRWQGKLLRVNGRVGVGSLVISPDRRSAAFALAPGKPALPSNFPPEKPSQSWTPTPPRNPRASLHKVR